MSYVSWHSYQVSRIYSQSGGALYCNICGYRCHNDDQELHERSEYHKSMISTIKIPNYVLHAIDKERKSALYQNSKTKQQMERKIEYQNVQINELQRKLSDRKGTKWSKKVKYSIVAPISIILLIILYLMVAPS
eukprot:UN12893